MADLIVFLFVKKKQQKRLKLAENLEWNDTKVPPPMHESMHVHVHTRTLSHVHVHVHTHTHLVHTHTHTHTIHIHTRAHIR